MFLFHNTTLEFLRYILKDKQLKAAYLTNNINEGESEYETKDQKFIYFSVIDDLKSKYTIFSDVTLYFDPKMLWNRTYYIAYSHTSKPHKLTERKNSKKYKQYYKYTNTVLNKLFNYAISKGEGFQVFQQVALKKQTNLKYLKAIRFNKSKPSQALFKLLSKEYPDVILKY